MSDIVWEDPPKSNRGGSYPGTTAKFVAELRKHPGRWARYPRIMAGVGCSEYRRKYPGTEWTARKREDGQGYDWYARFVGGVGSDVA